MGLGYLEEPYALRGLGAVVTGASSGAGRAIAPALGQARASRTMAGRNGELDDFAGVAVWLAGRSSAYRGGPTGFVEGGFPAT